MKHYRNLLHTYMGNCLIKYRLNREIKSIWLRHCTKKQNSMRSKKRLPMLEYIFLVVEIEQYYNITIYASEFRDAQEYSMLLSIVYQRKINV